MREKSQSGLPRFITYDGGFPVGKIRIWPAPMSGYSLRLLTEKPLSAFTLDTVVELPPGWNRAIISNLAEEMRSEYNQPEDPKLARVAADSLGLLKMNVARNHSMDSNPTGRYGGGNIYNGWML